MIALALLLAAAPLPALPSVFGLQLGAPVALPECRFAVINGKTMDIYASVQDRMCQYLPSTTMPTDGTVYFPPAEMPAVSSFNEIGTRIFDGKLEAIYFDTSSYASKDRIIGQLSEKFGKPDTVYAENTVLHGTPLPSAAAIWRRPGFTVVYHSIANSVTSGQVRIETDRAIAARDAEAHADGAKRTAL